MGDRDCVNGTGKNKNPRRVKRSQVTKEGLVTEDVACGTSVKKNEDTGGGGGGGESRRCRRVARNLVEAGCLVSFLVRLGLCLALCLEDSAIRCIVLVVDTIASGRRLWHI